MNCKLCCAPLNHDKNNIYHCSKCGTKHELYRFKFEKWILTGFSASYENGQRITGDCPNDFPEYIETLYSEETGLSALFG